MEDDRAPLLAVPDFTPVPRKYRQNGWTEKRQRGFVAALAATGSVTQAAAAVGMRVEGAYKLRRQPGAEEFAAAWAAALDRGVERLEDVALERAIHGQEEPVYSYGKLVGSRIVRNDRLLMFMLKARAAERFGKAGRQASAAERAQWERELRAQWHEEQRREAEAMAPIIRAELDRVRARLLARPEVRLVEEDRDGEEAGQR